MVRAVLMLALACTANWVAGQTIPPPGDWGNPKIAQIGPYVIVNGQPQPGDIISDGTHVGIVVGDHRTVSTNAYKGGIVDVNDRGFRPGQHPVIRRCNTCEK